MEPERIALVKRTNHSGKLNAVPAETIRRMYEDEKMSQTEIAKHFGVHQGAIYFRMKQYGIKARSHDDSIRLDRLKNDWTGENNPNWGGGRHTSKAGYVFVSKPDHPRASQNKGYVREHILVWEETHGQSLPTGWDVHHMNGVKDDNRPENLVAMPNREHKRVISEYKAHVKRLEDRVCELEQELRRLTK
jgi:hypothetical protein